MVLHLKTRRAITKKNLLQNLARQHSNVLANLTPTVRKKVEFLKDCVVKGRNIIFYILHMGFSQSSGAEQLNVKFKFHLDKHGIFYIESIRYIKDKPPRHKQNLFSNNLDVTTTKDELREAQEREKMLAEQNKVEQLKDQRNTLESFVYDTRSKISSAYQSFATNTEKDGITKSLQETKYWLYEDSDCESDE
nr:heat shock 70 kDa protein 16-like [Tanacetum cinerariifolium]